MTTYVGDKFKATSEHSLLLQEDEALYLFKQFISAVCYCHRHNLAHRSACIFDSQLKGLGLSASDVFKLQVCAQAYGLESRSFHSWSMTHCNYGKDTGGQSKRPSRRINL